MGSLMPGWAESGLPPKGFREEEDTESHSYRSNMLRRNSLTRTSAPVLSRNSPSQPVSPRTPTKSLSAKDHWMPSLTPVADEAAAQKRAEEVDAQPTRWWTKVDSGFFNDKPMEEVPADWKSGTYKPQADVARKLAGAEGNSTSLS